MANKKSRRLNAITVEDELLCFASVAFLVGAGEGMALGFRVILIQSTDLIGIEKRAIF